MINFTITLKNLTISAHFFKNLDRKFRMLKNNAKKIIFYYNRKSKCFGGLVKLCETRFFGPSL